MNADQLYSTLTDPKNYSNGVLTLPASAFGPGDFQNLITTWIGSNLVISGVSNLNKAGNTVVLDGQMSLLGVSDQQVQGVTFGLVDSSGNPTADGAVSLFINFPLPVQGDTPWKLSTSFPILKGTEVDSLSFSGPASFLLSSVDRPAHDGLPAQSAGLALNATKVSLAVEPLSTIQSLFGGAGDVSLSGPITILYGGIQNRAILQPGLSLESGRTDLGFLNASVYLQAVTKQSAGAGTSLEAQLLASIDITIGSTPPITLSADIGNLGKSLVLQADLGAGSAYALDALSSWLGGAALGNVFQGYNFQLGNYVALQQVRFFFDTSKLTTSPTSALSAVSVTVGTAQTWTIVKDYFDLDSIVITFKVNNPLGGSAAQSITTIVEGEVTFVDEIVLKAWGSFPDASFGLSTDESICFKQIFKQFNMNLSGFPDLVCEDFYIEATVPSGPFTVGATITSHWCIDIGAVNIELTQAQLSLEYDQGAITGSVDAVAKLVPKSGNGGGSDVPEFTVNWQIPGPFVLAGTFPDINLTALAQAVASEADLSLPSGFPDLNLQNSTVSLTVTPGQSTNQPTGTIYDFTLTTTVAIGSSVNIGFAAEVLKTQQATGFLAGIWSENWSWSPAQLPGWGDTFNTILGGITFENSGLIVSSLDNPTVTLQGTPSDVPQPLKKGLTFFTEIGFGKSALTALKPFFGDASGIKFYALLADPLANSSFTAQIGDTTGTQRYSFSGLQLMISAATKSFALQAGVSFTFTDVNGKDVTLTFIGGGRLSLEGEFDLYFVLKADEPESGETVRLLQQSAGDGPPPSSPGWKDPLGIQGLTIENFWGEIGVSAEGQLMLGFGGDLVIEQVQLELDLVGGFEEEVPIVDVFKFEIASDSPSDSITLTSLVRQFTSLDLSQVPLLGDISLKQFMVAVVLDPAGWTNPATGQIYRPGFYSSGDVTFFGFEVVFDIEIIFQTGIKASGYVDKPLMLGDGVFQLTDATGQKGPFGSIDTTVLTTGKNLPYVRLSGSLVLLAMSATIDAVVQNKGWAFTWKPKGFIFDDGVVCFLQNNVFYATVSGSLCLSIKTDGGVSVAGVEIIPPVGITIDMSMSITISINPGSSAVTLTLDNTTVTIDPGFKFEVAGSFVFGSQTLTVDVDLQISSWSDLKDLLEKYFEKYPKDLFRDLVSDAGKWAQAIADGAITFEGDVAQALHDAFHVGKDGAAELLHLAKYGEQEAIQALQNLWGATEEEAMQLVEEAWGGAKNCAIDTASKLM